MVTYSFSKMSKGGVIPGSRAGTIVSTTNPTSSNLQGTIAVNTTTNKAYMTVTPGVWWEIGNIGGLT